MWIQKCGTPAYQYSLQYSVSLHSPSGCCILDDYNLVWFSHHNIPSEALCDQDAEILEKLGLKDLGFSGSIQLKLP